MYIAHFQSYEMVAETNWRIFWKTTESPVKSIKPKNPISPEGFRQEPQQKLLYHGDPRCFACDGADRIANLPSHYQTVPGSKSSILYPNFTSRTGSCWCAPVRIEAGGFDRIGGNPVRDRNRTVRFGRKLPGDAEALARAGALFLGSRAASSRCRRGFDLRRRYMLICALPKGRPGIAPHCRKSPRLPEPARRSTSSR